MSSKELHTWSWNLEMSILKVIILKSAGYWWYLKLLNYIRSPWKKTSNSSHTVTIMLSLSHLGILKTVSLYIKLEHLLYGHLSSADVSTYDLKMQVYLMSEMWPFITVAWRMKIDFGLCGFSLLQFSALDFNVIFDK